MIQDDGMLEIDLDDGARSWHLLVLQLGEERAREWMTEFMSYFPHPLQETSS